MDSRIDSMEREFATCIKFLNAEMKRDGYETQPSITEVITQAQKEYTWFLHNYFAGPLSEREELIYYKVAFYKAVEAMYLPEYVIKKEEWIRPEDEQVFDAVSPASQARQKLLSEYTNLYAALKVIEDKAEALYFRHDGVQSSSYRDYETIMNTHVEVLAEVKFYYKRQALEITRTGEMDPVIAAETKGKCVQAIYQAVNNVQEKTPGWKALLTEVAVAISSLGIANIVNKAFTGSWTFFNTQHAAAKLNQAQLKIHQSIEAHKST